jgi:hypothetical protein
VPSTGQWISGYNGPNGASIHFTGSPTDPPGRQPTVTTVRLGTRQGVITGNGAPLWIVTWHADGSTYRLDYDPTEGDSLTLAGFKRLLTTMTWS